MKHHTKTKGDLAVLKVKVDLYEKGWLPLTPETEHAPFDLVGYKDDKFLRIQVKYRATVKDGRIEVAFRTSWADRHGSHIKYYDKKNLDLFAIYCPCTSKIYYLDPKGFSKSAVLDTKNRTTGHRADDYISIPE